ncbi:sugar ABC transporter permease [Mesorhizobium sp. M4B.F.Ca.ET.215.01.1.1]|uniref:multiple monosaccharide ABC transporter permease n=2 Tax=Mesorhizobium TaxID=68287 RepID=UPI000FD4697E|nr:MULTISPECIES: multiple monosaccharide ABC transporter permease [unclassified Mesorhizobium]RUW28204.1 sugar ABC transporter permease [Mesorhizobium sp. M4B.F.Ca.ET.013.02.1.1]TGQ15109.1 sugar ABC transporter permease [Mesorhizobium sp. M4B.F.Ca.ET.215.01.1.1]TGQ48684.1 sugar ABC transporter permease [Mesorhizobium sp. M00.F.Ca.ET.220.01.1.1]TGR11176.1 sugar ABC transporter permease [Mesorhizobium sp. M4B.F.Ca.ET.203.01.1.1]TGT44613.1 sugar ABC transporter permease [Mesorhizobium sp. M4B.F.C
MSTESAPAPQSGAAEDVKQGPRIAVSALTTNLREYGLIIALIVIMLFFQYTTSGTLFKPVNLSNLVQQNSFIIVMALGMLLVIVSGHIDLSVGSVAGFIGALAAMMMVIWPLGPLSNPLVVSIICLIVGGAIGAAQGYWIAYHRIPSFIVTLAGMLIFRGICQALLGGGSSVGPLPDSFKALSSGFIPDVIGPLTLIPPTVNAAGKTILGSGLTLHMTTIVLGLIAVLAYAYFGLRARRKRERHGYEAEPFPLFVIKTLVGSALALFLVVQFASYRGLPVVLLVMGVLISLFVFVTKRMTIGRRIYAMGGNAKAAQLSGINTERLTLLVFINMGVLSALGGLIIAARLGQAVPAAGLGSELDVIAAVFIGGASAMGGVGQVIGAVVGGFIMGVMNNGMSIMGVNVDWQQVVKGLVLLGAVIFDVYNKNKA